jgi:aminotransferase
MFDQAAKLKDTINLSIGDPGFITPKHIIDVGVKYLLAGKTHYVGTAGIIPLRDAIVKKLWEENHIKLESGEKNVIITIGATEAIILAMMTLSDYGDEVICPDPAWPDYVGEVQMVKATPVLATCTEDNGFRMTASVIETLITKKTKMIVLNSPCNPTGAMLSEKDLREIADLCKQHHIYVLSDEPYEKLIYTDVKHFSIGAVEGMEDYAITINSFSKSFAMTGWRVGYAAANADLIAAFTRLQENTISAVNEAFQLAAIEALQHGTEDIERMRQHYVKNRKILVDGLNRIKGFSCKYPEGAFYAFPNVKAFNMKSDDVADLILAKTGVITAPGKAFGPAGEGYLRLSYANDTESIVAALERMEKYFGTK